MKTALLVVSFGTSHPDTLEKTVTATENALARAFPEYPVYRAFTSGAVRGSLKAKYDIHVDSIQEAMAGIAAEGYERVIVQPTLLIPGAEYDKLCAAVQAAAGGMQVAVGKPLLWDDRDLDGIIQVLQSAYPVEDGAVLLLMAHGTQHSANGLYVRLARKLRPLPVRLCTVEATPSFEDAMEELSLLAPGKIRLAPMLFVAGDHAKNDMAGDTPDSLRSRLEEKGFSVECTVQGLGEIPAVRQMYIRRVRDAL